MCFSATASFIAAGTTALIGIATLSRVTIPRQIPLAAIPLVFAVQQATEGTLWLMLAPTAANPIPTASIASTIFLIIAHVLWPILVPTAVLLVEPKGWRRNLIQIGVALGVTVATYMAWVILSRPPSAAIEGAHIYYALDYPHHDYIGLAYLLATGIALVLSTHRMIAVMGALILVGYVISWFFYWHTFLSVWCFFAAAASIMLFAHFQRVHHLTPARPKLHQPQPDQSPNNH